MKTFIDPNLLLRLRVGPLAPYLDAYLKHIQQLGFLPTSAPMQMYAIARFSRWLGDQSFDLCRLDEAIVRRFLERDPSIVHSAESATIHRLLAMLRRIGVALPKTPKPVHYQQRFIEAYRCYLLQERGLAIATVAYFVRFAQEFLSDRFGSGDLNLAELRAQDVTDFVQQRSRQLSRGRAKLLVTALRSLLRYMRHRGEISIDAARCVPAVAMWSLSTLPKSLPPGAVQRLLDHCERETPLGKRNYAVLLLLARLGLRACEIVALELDDIDWDHARITIRGKGGRLAQMPLPTNVGQAIALYLHSGRPHCDSRRAFLRHRAPLRGFADSITVSSIVKRALIKAGIDSARKGAHLFRHTLATELLRQEVPLNDIGELLRHQSPNTTALYAKVDLIALRSLALPWPGGAQ
jgi:site-specific recombinase XerD